MKHLWLTCPMILIFVILCLLLFRDPDRKFTSGFPASDAGVSATSWSGGNNCDGENFPYLDHQHAEDEEGHELFSLNGAVFGHLVVCIFAGYDSCLPRLPVIPALPFIPPRSISAGFQS
jgi:hypothetical protein